MGTNPYSEQRLLIAHALDAIGDAHFALAGSGAIREHGLITRGTQDVDLFTVAEAIDRFPRAVSTLVDHLSNRGYHVMIRRFSMAVYEMINRYLIMLKNGWFAAVARRCGDVGTLQNMER